MLFLVLFTRPATQNAPYHLIISSFFCEEKLKKDIEGLIDPEEPRDGSATVGLLLDEHFAVMCGCIEIYK